MKLFRIKTRKVWHINSDFPGSQRSLCNNASAIDSRKYYGVFSEKEARLYRSQPDLEYADVRKVREIPFDIHDQICKACVQQAFSEGMVRIISREEDEK